MQNNFSRLFIALGFFTIIAFSCNSSKRETVENAVVSGENIYQEKCTICHGDNGKKGLSGANDLSVSQLTLSEKKQIITKGKGGMAGYGNILSEKEIEAVLEHITDMKIEK